ncbi:MAG: ABC transporter permease [Planctomycetota bacterium]|nr:ABC transporter permease [Planctomycetota bacterium]
MSMLAIVGAVAPWINNWLTPIWLLGVGALAGLLLLFLLWLLLAILSRIPGLGYLADPRSAPGQRGETPEGFRRFVRPICRLVSRRTVAEVPLAVREGVLRPLFVITVSLASFGILGTLLIREPLDLLASLTRLPYMGSRTETFEVSVSGLEDAKAEFSDPVAHELPVSISQSETRFLVFRSDQNLSISTRPFVETRPGASIDVIAGEELSWIKGIQTVNPFLEGDVSKLYVRNLGGQPAHFELTSIMAPPHPEIVTIPVMAISIVAVFLLYLLQQVLAPRLSAIALSTYKNEVAQPLFAILLTLGVVILVAYVFIPYNTFGEDIKVLKDTGLTSIMILGIFQAVWAAGNSVADELDGKTALTVLSKPIGRRSFILGKFLGIVWTVVLLFVVLGLLLLLVTAYKPIYDGKENSTTQDVTWQLCHLEMVYTVPGLVLAFLETVVLAAVSVAISTRLPLLANFVISFAIYVLGHLTPLIVQSSMGQFVFVQFFGQLIATIFPNLDHFNIQAAVAAGLPVPHLYLAWALVYCLIYSLIAMLLAWLLFEDRDLA